MKIPSDRISGMGILYRIALVNQLLMD